MNSAAQQVLSGLDDVDWAGLHHAYGPAVEVPENFYGLLGEDPDLREESLDFFYGAVHHQGDVSDCTVAAVPFLLRAILHPEVPDRPQLVRLLASICGWDDGTVHIWDEGQPDPYGMFANRRRVRDVVAESWTPMSLLLNDSDAGLRSSAASLLACCVSQWPQTLQLLLDNDRTEDSLEVRLAIVSAASAIGRHLSPVPARLRGWLTGLAGDGDGPPVLALQAITELMAVDETAYGDDVAAVIAAAVNRCYATDRRKPAPMPPPLPGPPTTLIAAVNDISARAIAGVRLPEVTPMLGAALDRLGPRIDDRVALLIRILDMPDLVLRDAACRMACQLMSEWRSDGYDPLVVALGRQLSDRQVRDTAAGVLAAIGPLAGPAADRLVEIVETDDPLARYRDGFSSSPFDTPAAESALSALAGLADSRAIPWIQRILEFDEPEFLHTWLGMIHPHTRDMLVLLRARMRYFADRETSTQVYAIAQAIGRLGPAGADAVPDLMEVLPRVENPQTILTSLGRVGPDAAGALPAIRPYLADPNRETALAAAEAWWLIAADPEPALTLIADLLAGDNIYHQRDAAQVAAKLGVLARPLRGRIEQMTTVDGDPGTWSQAHAAIALWHITGEAQPTVSMLLDAVTHNEVILESAVVCFAAIGPQAADALPLLERKVADPLRHHTLSFDTLNPISDDIAFQAGCRHAIARITGRPDGVPGRP